MKQETAEKWKSFLELLRKIASYHEAVSLMHWDLRTGAPRKGAEARSETIGLLSTEAFKLQTSTAMGEFLSYLNHQTVLGELDETGRRLVQLVQEEYDRSVKIPPAKFQEYAELTAHAETLWEDYKESGDFAGFEPYLTRIVALTQEFIDYWGPKETRYDTLLDMYEPDLTVEKLDQVFGKLRDRLVPVVDAITSAPHKPQAPFLNQLYDKEQQKKIGIFLLEQIGYDFEAGRVDETVHPFEITLNQGDVRITTHYVQDDVTNSIFSNLHEGGHALYEQNVSKELAGTPLSQGTSMGIHESQSRFWENFVGRSRDFWERYYGDLQQHFPEQLKDVTVDEFYRGINRVENSLIRIDADELTYNLHIIIRYEIEKMIFNEGLPVSELPKVWNEKYKAYLGLTPPNDSLGVLQDVHWSGGSFGYFPSYALGNMYAAQIANTLKNELPQFEGFIAEGNFAPIKEWLTEKIYKYGKSLKPAEIIMNVTGEELNPDYLADYLEQKYKGIYGL
ncbi:carboxypeptidase Taq [Fontibacillus phaseoli]|uniref:Metal-dependent carboxypeptidase n=1 Tax=Fontibacillus phaseoli TaxID=1416533 RepID=A0A369BQ22_9BACL|nr:carboxypeptidase M32 [Fontibacillus phaseoli]RCX23491.1 carboxypeptidase Taq [Fontibacillus phaseoli]